MSTSCDEMFQRAVQKTFKKKTSCSNELFKKRRAVTSWKRGRQRVPFPRTDYPTGLSGPRILPGKFFHSSAENYRSQ